MQVTETLKFTALIVVSLGMLFGLRFSCRRAVKYTRYEARCHKDRWANKGRVLNVEDDAEVRLSDSRDAYMLFGFNDKKQAWEMIELSDVPAVTWDWHLKHGCEVPDIEYTTQESLVASLPPAWARI